jgi:hypothetical protein
LVGVDFSRDQAQEIASAHDFETYSDTGKLRHRRLGRAGLWRESDNSTEEVRQIAGDILGGLRTRLEYT